MEKTIIYTDRATKPEGCYSQATRFQRLIFTAGSVGKDPKTGQVVPGGIRAQVRQTLENLKAVLEEAHTSLDNVLKVNAYLRDMSDFEAYNEVYSEYFDTDAPPARTTVEVGSFPGDIAVEIDAIAYVPGSINNRLQSGKAHNN